MKSAEYFDKVRHLEWLEAILRDYNENIDLIHREQDNFVVQGIRFTARGNGEVMNISSHYSIPYGYILNGLNASKADSVLLATNNNHECLNNCKC